LNRSSRVFSILYRLNLALLPVCLRYTSTRLKSDFDRIIARATAPNAAPTLLFTIFIGANDACFMGEKEFVPWPTFSENIRFYIDTILTEEALEDTKIVLIGPPPINGSETGLGKDQTEDDIERLNGEKKAWPRYKTYMSKKRYAEGMMDIAKEYEETERVIALNLWQGIVEEKLKEDGKGSWEELQESGLWPGCGLIGAKSFGKGWFTDGLHLNRKGYGVLNRMLIEEVEKKWPELAVENQ
jgi:lysophospholipase L1-like esterase